MERAEGKGRGGGEKLLLQIEPWHRGPVPTYRANKHKEKRNTMIKNRESSLDCFVFFMCWREGRGGVPTGAVAADVIEARRPAFATFGASSVFTPCVRVGV
jgi:hypothetical protein